MELREFISDVFASIIAGVSDAEAAAKEHGAVINPRGETTVYGRGGDMRTETKVKTYEHQSVDFDVALTVESSNSKDAGGKIAVMSAGLGGNVASSSKNSSVSRIKFSIPIILPSVGHVKD